MRSSFVFMCFERTLFFRVCGGPPDPAFSLLFHDNPARRTSVISTPNTVFFPKAASRAKISANPVSRQEILHFPESALYLGQIPDPENTFSVPDTHVLVPYKALLLGIVKWQEHLCVICCIAHYKFDVCINTVCCIKCNFFLGRFNPWLKEKNTLRSI